MKIEIDSTNLIEWLAKATECRSIVFQDLDLRTHDDALIALSPASNAGEGCVYLGCTLGPKMAAAVSGHFALIFPNFPDRAYKPYRASLYSPDELFAGFDPADPVTYRRTPDWQTYVGYIKVDANHLPLKPVQYVEAGLDEVLARRMHDNFVEDATDEFLDQFRGPGKKGIVAIMGGHDRLRSDPAFAQVAHLARTLTRDGYLVASGGGPGLMEAANLGAYFAAWDDAGKLDAAIDAIKAAAKFDHPDWLRLAWQVVKANPSPDPLRSRSLGVPTWFYGHEPPNVFATHIAKYFENSLREEGLLAIATHGVIFAEGNAGTVQEIFQDGCQNYYDNYGFKSPMILFGTDYWHPKVQSIAGDYPVYPDKVLPAWPLIQGLAQKKNFSSLLKLTSDTGEVLAAIRAFQSPWTDP